MKPLAVPTAAQPGQEAAAAATAHGIALSVVKRPEATKGFVLLPRRWVVERSFAWAARFRRLARDYERLATTLAGMHLVAYSWLMLPHAVKALVDGLQHALTVLSIWAVPGTGSP